MTSLMTMLCRRPTYKYDAEHRLVQALRSGLSSQDASSYSYDDSALRIKKVVGATNTTTVYVYANGLPIAEYVNGALSSEYVYAGSSLIASLDSAGTATYYLRDHLSPRVMTDAQGTVVGTSGHLPFGDEWYASGTGVNNRWKFTSYERDSDAGLDYAMFRHYDFRIARFMQVDPVEADVNSPQGWNGYTYVLDAPVDFVDPLGLWEKCYGPNGTEIPCRLAPPDCDEAGSGCSTSPGALTLAISHCATIYQDGVYVGNICGDQTVNRPQRPQRVETGGGPAVRSAKNGNSQYPSWDLHPNACTDAADARFRAAVQQASEDSWSDLLWGAGGASAFGVLGKALAGAGKTAIEKEAMAPFAPFALMGALAGASPSQSRTFNAIQQQHQADLAACQTPLVSSH